MFYDFQRLFIGSISINKENMQNYGVVINDQSYLIYYLHRDFLLIMIIKFRFKNAVIFSFIVVHVLCH